MSYFEKRRGKMGKANSKLKGDTLDKLTADTYCEYYSKQQLQHPKSLKCETRWSETKWCKKPAFSSLEPVRLHYPSKTCNFPKISCNQSRPYFDNAALLDDCRKFEFLLEFFKIGSGGILHIWLLENMNWWHYILQFWHQKIKII